MVGSILVSTWVCDLLSQELVFLLLMISQEPKWADLSHTTLHLCVLLRYLTDEILLPLDEELVDVMWLDTIRKSNPGFLEWRTSTFKVNIIKTQINLFNYKPLFKYVIMKNNVQLTWK